METTGRVMSCELSMGGQKKSFLMAESHVTSALCHGSIVDFINAHLINVSWFQHPTCFCQPPVAAIRGNGSFDNNDKCFANNSLIVSYKLPSLIL